jgi:hypothetical protein
MNATGAGSCQFRFIWGAALQAIAAKRFLRDSRIGAQRFQADGVAPAPHLNARSEAHENRPPPWRGVSRRRAGRNRGKYLNNQRNLPILRCPTYLTGVRVFANLVHG